MITFDELENILAMDLTKMRALDASGGKRASDVAINSFVNGLVSFYNQFKEPSAMYLEIYQDYMERIVAKINKAEYDYYLQKYTEEGQQQAEAMAASSMLVSVQDLPKRMQYWAAAEKFGDTIRNAENHRIAVKGISDWANFERKLTQHNRRYALFNIENNESDAEDNIEPSSLTF